MCETEFFGSGDNQNVICVNVSDRVGRESPASDYNRLVRRIDVASFFSNPVFNLNITFFLCIKNAEPTRLNWTRPDPRLKIELAEQITMFVLPTVDESFLET